MDHIEDGHQEEDMVDIQVEMKDDLQEIKVEIDIKKEEVVVYH